MKKNFLLFFLLLTFYHGYCQDYIQLKNGENFYCKIITITPIDLFYKDTTIIDTTTHSIRKKDILFIKFQNGIKEIVNTDYSENSSISNERVKYFGKKSPIYFYDGDYFIKDKRYDYPMIKMFLLGIGDEKIDSLIRLNNRIRTTKTILAYANIPFGVVAVFSGIASAANLIDFDGSVVQPSKPQYLITSTSLAVIGIVNVVKIESLIRKQNRNTQLAIDIYNQKIKENLTTD